MPLYDFDCVFIENTVKGIGIIETSYEVLVDCCLEIIAVEVLLTSKVVLMCFTLVTKTSSLATSVSKWNHHELSCCAGSCSLNLCILSPELVWGISVCQGCFTFILVLNYFCKFEPL